MSRRFKQPVITCKDVWHYLLVRGGGEEGGRISDENKKMPFLSITWTNMTDPTVGEGEGK